VTCAARWCRWARTESTATNGLDEIARNPFNCPDKDKAAFFEGYLDGIRKNGSSIGAVIEIVAEGVPGMGRADLRQARCRIGRGADEHQCGEGR